jgi:hypothetical protein
MNTPQWIIDAGAWARTAEGRKAIAARERAENSARTAQWLKASKEEARKNAARVKRGAGSTPFDAQRVENTARAVFLKGNQAAPPCPVHGAGRSWAAWRTAQAIQWEKDEAFSRAIFGVPLRTCLKRQGMG